MKPQDRATAIRQQLEAGLEVSKEDYLWYKNFKRLARSGGQMAKLRRYARYGNYSAIGNYHNR